MKFIVRTTGRIYCLDDQHTNMLKKIGFRFKDYDSKGSPIIYKNKMVEKIKDEIEIEINNLEELIEFCNKTNNEVIISGQYLEIYDDYRE